ncbi:inosine/uridine-preferring nucleoside hydrolase [Colletotrichum tofieldiae]|uniref:Inosine-uridine preferring nucleoside hydrolase n=1 Tax=Colletotrichum tofieldiae TaxID=708197 RepID=A0A166WVN8_9PEZI|nr:inosine-uridine preferring nucleoside hydrolase [Colletotrichum tofieldiae]GKT55317.1 inosine-uridine preferring nucleoside hydrolase [Colletotrichum tofieldiae]GKT75392.1 inosine/uridine-preferring nucleoside hydrolase [Colletotrichum tofieldiae]GKT83058.1 inosine-uridine preferring nucleoside hydrolase [Colletotrichum tofieldiae]
MAPKNRVIIDSDPGIDDVLAMLLALSASPEELEVMMISVTYGNVPLQSCLRNVVALFHVLEKEIAWRKANGKPEGFEALKAYKPIVSVGAEHPLEDDELAADYFHGLDGLHGVHEQHPHLTPDDRWKSLFHAEKDLDHDPSPFSKYFTPAKQVAHKEILRILKENPPNTISICVVGPMTNVALAAAEDPETFLRVKELCVMGGAVHVEGNITPVGEFNTFADTVAAARVFALTSPTPRSTMPPISDKQSSLPPYPAKLSSRLKLTLFPLDITTPHLLMKNFFTERIEPVVQAGSPLGQWVNHFMSKTFEKIDSMEGNGQEPGLSLHDPLTVWYLLTQSDPKWKPVAEPEDIRIETSGQWTRGMHVIDRRIRAKYTEAALETNGTKEGVDVLTLAEVPGDTGGWLSTGRGNRINRMLESPGEELFALDLMKRVFG